MTMQHHTHPDDERLAALAAGDPDLAFDRELAAHVAACDRCGPLVTDLVGLRTALAELPDLVPSRPLQLVPPVPVASAPSGRLGWLRGLAAPAMAAGAGLVLIGAVGLSTAALGGMAASGGAAMDAGNERDEQGGQAPELASPVPGYVTGSASPGPIDDGDSGEEPSDVVADLTDVNGPTPWVALLTVGAALLLAGLLLRFFLRPRAG